MSAMTEASDIALMLTSDGQEWGKYISDRLNLIPKVTHSTLVLNEQDYENPPEVLVACKHSVVTLLLVTPQFIDYLHDKAGWFSKSLLQVPSTSTVIAVLLLERKDLDAVTARNSYVTSDWKYMDAGATVDEVQQMIAEVLNVMDLCKEMAAGRIVSSISDRKSSPPRSSGVELYPSTIHEHGEKVAMVFQEDVKGTVSIKVEQNGHLLTTTRENSRVFTFCAPELSAGKYNLRVQTDSKKFRCVLRVRGVKVTSFTSLPYLQQCLGLQDKQQLDQRLKDVFNNSLPADRSLDVFQNLSHMSDMDDSQKISDTQYPTLLHYAAAHGLFEFCAALLDCPGSSRAFRMRNCDGHDPAELAALNNFEALGNYIIDFMEMQTACSQYISMIPQPDDDGSSDYEILGSTPALPPRRYQPSDDLCPERTIHHNRPPAPPPREKGGSVRSNSQKCPSPTGSKMDAETFMGMRGGDAGAAAQAQSPRGATRSGSQSELIDMNEMVKNKEINIEEARMLFNAWQQRYGRNNATSFKDRQKELKHIRTKYGQVRDELKKQDGQSKNFFSRHFCRQTKPTVKLHITDPVTPRQKKTGTKVYVKSASTSQLPSHSTGERGSTSSTASSGSSRDSGWSQGSRDSAVSGSGEPQRDCEADDGVFSESLSRRDRRTQSNTSSLHRQSLGDLYLQQAQLQEQTEKSVKPLPPLPPRTHCPPLTRPRISSKTST